MKVFQPAAITEPPFPRLQRPASGRCPGRTNATTANRRFLQSEDSFYAKPRNLAKNCTDQFPSHYRLGSAAQGGERANALVWLLSDRPFYISLEARVFRTLAKL